VISPLGQVPQEGDELVGPLEVDELAGLLEADGLVGSQVDGVPMGLRPGVAPVGSDRDGAWAENHTAEKAVECWLRRTAQKNGQSHEKSRGQNHELNRGRSHEQGHGQSHGKNRQDRRQRCRRLGLGPRRVVRRLDSCYV
jgi:hypothetical protein